MCTLLLIEPAVASVIWWHLKSNTSALAPYGERTRAHQVERGSAARSANSAFCPPAATSPQPCTSVEGAKRSRVYEGGFCWTHTNRQLEPFAHHGGKTHPARQVVTRDRVKLDDADGSRCFGWCDEEVPELSWRWDQHGWKGEGRSGAHDAVGW